RRSRINIDAPQRMKWCRPRPANNTDLLVNRSYAFAQLPERFVELDVLVDAADLAGRALMPATIVVAARSRDAATNDVLLPHVEDGPKIVPAVTGAPRVQQLLWGDRSRDVAFCIGKTQPMR